MCLSYLNLAVETDKFWQSETPRNRVLCGMRFYIQDSKGHETSYYLYMTCHNISISHAKHDIKDFEVPSPSNLQSIDASDL